MNNLVIGNTSQLSHYFPDDYEKISSRNINVKKLINRKFDRVFLTFVEQRTYKEDAPFEKINVNLTLDLIDVLKHVSNKLIVYGTCELWNNCEGPVDINTPYNYNYTPYIESKHNMTVEIQLKKLKNVIIIHPFNFNSIHRNGDFLFSKIFKSLINEEHITIGNTYFYRDLIHPSYIVERSILAEQDELVGSGRLIFINDFIQDLYNELGLKYNKLIKEDFDKNLKNKRRIFYNSEYNYSYERLLNTTVDELKNKIS